VDAVVDALPELSLDAAAGLFSPAAGSVALLSDELPSALLLAPFDA
jgi:hypothetical protein